MQNLKCSRLGYENHTGRTSSATVGTNMRKKGKRVFVHVHTRHKVPVLMMQFAWPLRKKVSEKLARFT